MAQKYRSEIGAKYGRDDLCHAFCLHPSSMMSREQSDTLEVEDKMFVDVERENARIQLGQGLGKDKFSGTTRTQ